MGLKVFADLMSQPARAIVIFCRAANIEHELVNTRIAKGDTRTKEYTAMNPFQKVPVIKDGDFALTESVAMYRYLAREKGISDHWYPQDSKAQARVDEYLEWQHLNTRMFCAGYFQAKWLIPTMKQRLPNEKTVERFHRDMNSCLNNIEEVWLKNGEKSFICGNEISVADIVACCELEQPGMAGYDIRKDRPVLAAYMDRVKNRLNPHYDSVHSIVYKIRDTYGGLIPGVNAPQAKL